MQLVGNKLVIPLFDAELSNEDSYELCDGVYVFTLPDSYKERLRSTPPLVARYESSLKYMKCGLAIEPAALDHVDKLSLNKLIEFGAFIAMVVRLATGVPVDIPYWFDVNDEEIEGCGNTRIQTYRIGSRYLYPLDVGKQSDGLVALQGGIADVVQKFIEDASKNVLIRAIEFTAIGFQTKHISTRLINNTIFIESLFSTSNIEISFQIASRASWYLGTDTGTEGRLELFSKIKELYGYRSKIVHGANISTKSRKLREVLLLSEDLCTNVFRNILTRRHIEVFSMNQKKRQEELRKLSLGAGSVLLEQRA